MDNLKTPLDRCFEIAHKARVGRDELEEVQRLGKISGALPPADGRDKSGAEFWFGATIRNWAVKAPRHRSPATMSPTYERATPITTPAGRAPSTLNERNMTVEAVLTTEQPVVRRDFNVGGYVNEVLAASGGRFGASTPLLINHDDRVEMAIGSVVQPKQVGRQWEGLCQFGPGELSLATWEKLKFGSVNAVSIRYSIEDWQYLKQGESAIVGGVTYRNDEAEIMLLAKKWTVLEVSVVTIPADNSARFKSQGGNMPAIAPAPRAPLSLRECFQRDGIPFHGDPSESLFQYTTLRNVRSTTLIPQIVNPLKGATEEGFASVIDSTEGWVNVVDVPTFAAWDVANVAGVRLTEQARGEEAEHSELLGPVGSVRVRRFSAQSVVDEQDLINADSLAGRGFIDRTIPRAYGAAAGRVRPDVVYAILLANPTLEDGVAAFHADRNNVFTCTLAELDATLGEAAAAMAAQQGDGQPLNLKPDYIISAVALEREVRKRVREVDLLSSANTPTPVVRSDARIDAVSPATIFLASGTAGFGVTVAYLEGDNRRPLFSDWILSRGRFGLGYSVQLRMGVALVDARGLAKIVIEAEE